MKRKHLFRFVYTILLSVLILGIAGCAQEEDPRLDFLLETEPVPYDGVAVSDERIAELRADIERYEEDVAEVVQGYGKIASFHKLLAQELLQREMYGPALESVEAAMHLQPENAILFYFGGIAAARSARAHMLDGEETSYHQQAEALFRESLALRPDYKDALFAMAVLLAFDLNRADEALEFSSKLSELETGDPDVKFLHANILVRNGEISRAIEVYELLAESAPSSDQRRRARENLDELERRGGGS